MPTVTDASQRDHTSDFGLMDYNARFYSPRLGRFTQPDSITPGISSQAYNRYAYVNNNPIMMNDPTGHFANGICFDNGYCGNTASVHNAGRTAHCEILLCQKEVGWEKGGAKADKEAQEWVDSEFGFIEDRLEDILSIPDKIRDWFWSSEISDSIPTTISIQFDGGTQGGFIAEGGGGKGEGFACNWVAGECAQYGTEYGYLYLGGPSGVSTFGNFSIAGYGNSTSVYDLNGPGAFAGLAGGLDSVLGDFSLGIGSTRSTASQDPFAKSAINDDTGKPLNGGFLSLSVSADAISTGLNVGGSIGAGNTVIDNSSYNSASWWPLRWLVP